MDDVSDVFGVQRDKRPALSLGSKKQKSQLEGGQHEVIIAKTLNHIPCQSPTPKSCHLFKRCGQFWRRKKLQ